MGLQAPSKESLLFYCCSLQYWRLNPRPTHSTISPGFLLIKQGFAKLRLLPQLSRLLGLQTCTTYLTRRVFLKQKKVQVLGKWWASPTKPSLTLLWPLGLEHGPAEALLLSPGRLTPFLSGAHFSCCLQEVLWPHNKIMVGYWYPCAGDTACPLIPVGKQ